MTSFAVWSFLAYLTNIDGVAWRPKDHDVNKMIKCLKGDPINGYFTIKGKTKSYVYRESNREEFLNVLCAALAKKIGSAILGEYAIVPVPNSSTIIANRNAFRTQEIADKVVGFSSGNGVTVPALRWKSPKLSSRKGGTRDPQALFDNLEMVAKPARPVVLFDDVMTTGAHMIACRQKLQEAGSSPVLHVVAGRSTRDQRIKPIEWVEEIIDLGDADVAWDFDL